MIRNSSLVLLFFLLLTTLASVQTPAFGQQAARVDPAAFPEVVARVNGRDIRKVELLTQAELMRAQIRRSGQGDPAGDPAFYREVLNGLIGEVLVYQFTQKENLGASGEEVEAKIKEMGGRFADAAAFDKALTEQGSSRDDLRRQLRETLSVQRFVDQEIAARVSVPEASQRSFYEENLGRIQVPERRRVRHILLRAPRNSSSELRDGALQRAQVLGERIAAGTDFAGLAKIHSEDEASKQEGGDLGWIERSGSRPEFEAAAFGLAATGDVSEVVETAAGYHLVQLLEVQAGKTPSFDEVRPQIEQRMKEQIIQQEIARRVETLRAEADIQILI